MKGLKKAEQQPLLEAFKKQAPAPAEGEADAAEAEAPAASSGRRRLTLPKKANIRQLEKLLKRFQ